MCYIYIHIYKFICTQSVGFIERKLEVDKLYIQIHIYMDDLCIIYSFIYCYEGILELKIIIPSLEGLVTLL